MPGDASPIVREDRIPSTNSFIVDAENNKMNADQLRDSGKWLWFKPDAIMALNNERKFFLSFNTKDTGVVSGLHGYNIHFGINDIGLLNVYADDIAFLPDWQQKIWAGYNIAPEGGVSKELLDIQVHIKNIETQAPEEFIEKGTEYVNNLASDKLKVKLFKPHANHSDIIRVTHRFRSLDLNSFFSLAKDMARLSADSLDLESMKRVLLPPKGKNWGSLKHLENILAPKIGQEIARKIMSPIVGIYELRLADAHLPSNEINDAFQLLHVDRTAPFVIQGYQLLVDFVSWLYILAEILKDWE
jgi:hypothetical protein